MTMPARHILFADDDVLSQWVMTDVLTKMGFSVFSVCRGAEALDLLQGGAAFDLLLVDSNLPDLLECQELRETWRKSQPGRPVIYTGANRDRSPQLLGGHEYFIEKPLEPISLIALIDRAIEDCAFVRASPAPPPAGSYVH